MTGIFITLEGGEGAGKSTQLRLLAHWLRSTGRTVAETREPGGSADAEAVRRILLSGRARVLGALGEAYLFAAARIDHLETLIRPALAAGQDVLCDRFMDSTRVYQGVAGGLGTDVIDWLEQAAVGDTRPDLTLVLDLPAEIGLARAHARNPAADRFEADDAAVHEARRAGFLAVAAANPVRCRVIDASRSPEEVATAIRSAVAAPAAGKIQLMAAAVDMPFEADQLEGIPLPQQQLALFGHQAAALALHESYLSGRMHHAWLLTGPRGIGKATLAFRFARFALSHPQAATAPPPQDGVLQPVLPRVAGPVAQNAHPNILHLKRHFMADKDRFASELLVGEVRRLAGFFGQTAGSEGLRIAVIDAADDMTASAANALLKMLEEPPRQSLFLVLSHVPGKLLPTIRSRCRKLPLRPLEPHELLAAINNLALRLTRKTPARCSGSPGAVSARQRNWWRRTDFHFIRRSVPSLAACRSSTAAACTPSPIWPQARTRKAATRCWWILRLAGWAKKCGAARQMHGPSAIRRCCDPHRAACVCGRCV